MVSTGTNYTKLKTNLRLAINRLKLLEKKKSELALKARKEIASYIQENKVERARIKVEHIIREDYLVEAMELVEMFSDLLLARFGLIQQMKTLDEGLAEAISSMIWVAPRLQAECQELKVISDLLTVKYGKPYAQAARENALGTVSEKLILKLSVQAPPKILVENYLIEIAKASGVSYEGDESVLNEHAVKSAELAEEAIAKGVPQSPVLIDFGANPTLGGACGGTVVSNSTGYPMGGSVCQQPVMPMPGLPPLPSKPPTVTGPAIPVDPNSIGFQPENDEKDLSMSRKPGDPSGGGSVGGGSVGGGSVGGGGGSFFLPAGFDSSAPPPSYDSSVAASGGQNRPISSAPPSNLGAPPSSLGALRPTPAPRSNTRSPGVPQLPDVPADSPSDGSKDGARSPDEETIDFDDLARRFEALKKKK